MAEVENADASSPESNGGAAGGLKAAKDRNCPFCGQSFTSSSLGRHLDLYIKPKNPKAPDGVHNVDEIRKIRGGITRRQPRTSLKPTSGQEEESESVEKRIWTDSQPEVGASHNDYVQSPRESKGTRLQTWFNAANWQATGVINNLPPRAPSRTSIRSPNGHARQASTVRPEVQEELEMRPEYVTDDVGKLREAAELGRAAEMALREVMASLEAAKKRVEPNDLFEDFDYFSLSFPGICLALLAPPPAIFSSTPFPAGHTWAIQPPGEIQRSALVRVLHERMAAVRNDDVNNLSESAAFRYRVHLDGAYEQWQTLSAEEQTINWHLEVCRAFVRSREKTEGLKRDLETAQQRIWHLEMEYDRLSRCQLPRDYLLHPPNTIPIPAKVAQEMRTSNQKFGGAAELTYDVDALLDKWKTSVKRMARPVKPPTTAKPYIESDDSHRGEYSLRRDMFLNGTVLNVNGPMPRDIENTPENPYPPAIDYRTPQEPGTVISPPDDVENTPNVSQAGFTGSSADFSSSGTLVRLRDDNQSTLGPSNRGMVNANGKRPLTPASGKAGRGPKIYRERSL